jgi:hypothetical protein
MTADRDNGTTGPAALARAVRHEVAAGSTRIGDERREVRRYVVECQLDALSARSQISDRQWRGGIMFRARWLKSRRASRVTAGYGTEPGGRAYADGPAIGLDARSDVTAALAALPKGLSLAVIAVCGEDESPGGRGRVVALRDGLDVLADHFGVPVDYCRSPIRQGSR